MKWVIFLVVNATYIILISQYYKYGVDKMMGIIAMSIWVPVVLAVLLDKMFE